MDLANVFQLQKINRHGYSDNLLRSAPNLLLILFSVLSSRFWRALSRVGEITNESPLVVTSSGVSDEIRNSSKIGLSQASTTAVR